MNSETNIQFIDSNSPPNGSCWNHISVIGKECMYDLAEEIYAEKTDLIIINVHFQFSPSDRDFEKYEYLQDCAGIDLLKFLRLLGVRTHCILLSPLSSTQLLQLKPGNLIIASKGVTVFPYAGNFEDIEPHKYIKKEADAHLPDIYFRTDFRLPEDHRHNWANWFGVDRLWNVHQVVEKNRYSLTKSRWKLSDYPDSIKKKVKELRNLQALYLYGHQDEVIQQDLVQLEQEKDSQETVYAFLLEIKKTLTSIIDILGNLHIESETRLNLHVKSLKDLKNIRPKENEVLLKHILGNIISPDEHDELIYKLNELDKKISDRQDVLSNVVEGKIEEAEQKLIDNIKGIKSIVIEKVCELESLISNTNSKIQNLSINELREKLIKRKPRILYIDDQADEGWTNIFQQIIYNTGETELFDYLQPDLNSDIDKKYFNEVVCPKIQSPNQPDLVLLDLRLQKETGIRVDADNLSGGFLLKQIRDEFPGLPVLITTASNKSWSYEELQRIGADAYWTKEGIDLGMREKESVQNYLRFVELVERATSEKFKFVLTISDKIKEIETEPKTFWWENMKAPGGNRKINKEEVVSILYDGILLIKDYLANVELKKVDFISLNQWFHASMIIQHLAKIIELIHDTTKLKGIPKHDRVAKSLYTTRHNASHMEPLGALKGARSLTIETTMEWTTKLINYLIDDEPKKGLKVLGRFK